MRPRALRSSIRSIPPSMMPRRARESARRWPRRSPGGPPPPWQIDGLADADAGTDAGVAGRGRAVVVEPDVGRRAQVGAVLCRADAKRLAELGRSIGQPRSTLATFHHETDAGDRRGGTQQDRG